MPTFNKPIKVNKNGATNHERTVVLEEPIYSMTGERQGAIVGIMHATLKELKHLERLARKEVVEWGWHLECVICEQDRRKALKKAPKRK